MVLLRAQVSLWVIATIATVVPLAAATCAFTNKDFDVKPDEPFNLTWTSDTELGVDITLNRLDVEEDHMRLLQYIVKSESENLSVNVTIPAGYPSGNYSFRINDLENLQWSDVFVFKGGAKVEPGASSPTPSLIIETDDGLLLGAGAGRALGAGLGVLLFLSFFG